MSAMFVARNTGGTVEFDQPLKFNTVPFFLDGINYSPETGTFTLLRPGIYAFNWWVNLQSAVTASGSAFALVTSSGAQYFGTSDSKSGQITGTAVLEVADTGPVTATLRYFGTNFAVLSEIAPIKAGATVTHIPQPAFGARFRQNGGVIAVSPTFSTVELNLTTIARAVSLIPANTITITRSGIYRVEAFLTGTSSVSTWITVQVAVNGSGTVPVLRQTQDVILNVPVTFAISGFASLDANSALTLEIASSAPLSFTFSPNNTAALLSVQQAGF